MIEFHGNLHFQTAQLLKVKVFWAVVICLTVSSCFYFSSVTIERFLDYPTAVSISFTYESNMVLPDLMFCSSQLFDVAKLIAKNVSKSHISYLQDYFTYNAQTDEGFEADSGFHTKYDHAKMDSEIAAIYGKSDFESFVVSLSINCEDLLLYCSIESTSFNCCQSVISVPHHMFGECFALTNLSQFGSQSAPGARNGLTILTKKLQTSEETSSLVDSVYVEIADRFLFPTLTHFPLMSVKSNYLELVKTKSQMSPNRIGGCLSDSRISTKLCGSAAYAETFSFYCNCTEIGYRTPDQIHFGASRNVCVPNTAVSCNLTPSPNFDKTYKSILEKYCSKPNCNEVEYVFTATVVGIQQSYARKLRNETNSKVVYTRLLLYYQTLGYQTYTEFQSMTFDSVLSAVGGNIGLFMGASLVTLVQFGSSTLQWAILSLRKFIGILSETVSSSK